ncbi:MAG TPA: DUF2231 domain-containing protein [Gemmatimonadaceae bacterium]|nr:DUF2231 domain-containing protein [Gemmatimonadaceae bacterium]
MLPSPLHPAIIHFPLVLMLLLPIVIAGALWAIRRGANARRAWTIPLLGAAALSASTWLAVETGQQQSERVERVVSEQPVETHEEAAELFFTLSGALLVVTAAGMMRGSLGRSARVLATAGAVGIATVGVRVGATGGELVYKHGAADAYTQSTSVTRNSATPRPGTRVEQAGGEVRER